MADQILTQEKLHQLFDYKNGELFWKIRNSYSVQIGDKAGCLNTNGYYRVRINKKMYGVHRIIFAWHYGYFPKQIDHIDRNPSNNKIENLREANPSQNMGNSVYKAGISGKKNVLWRKNRQKWVVQIKFRGKNIVKGSFNTVEEAEQYAINLREKLHQNFANHNSFSSKPSA
jgi:hypothetical protein